MKYGNGLTETIRKIWEQEADKEKKPAEKPEEKPAEKPEEKPEEKTEDKDAIIKKLQDEIATLKLKAETEKSKVLKPEPNKKTGEIPLRTGIAHAILDKGKTNGIIDKKGKKEKVSVGGKTKVDIDPEANIGIASGGGNTGSGQNLH
tara:strand:- start:1267 stop:1707 length:441 start_codon:yes stop_codon:yes gene_type:complete